MRVLLAYVASLVLAGTVAAQTQQSVFDRFPSQKKEQKPAAQSARKTAYELDIPGNQIWQDTGIDLYTGDRIQIAATGTVTFAGQKPNGPDGLARAWRDLLRQLPIGDAGRGALIGRFGEGDAAEAFLVGSQRDYRVTQAGRLFLGVNENSNDPADGKYQVKIVIVEQGKPSEASADGTTATTGGLKTTPEISGVTPEMFEKLPRRNQDKAGTLGDMVNFVVLGSEDRVRQALAAGGWVLVDRTAKDTIIHGVLATLSKQSYLTLPMSELYLFDRPQDFGYAHGEPLAVIAQRHHFRLWKASFQTNGQTTWIGTGTHDIGFDRDQRNGKITHKIDPDIDKERDYIGASFAGTGLVAETSYILPSNPLKTARTAHGEDFSSDGRVLIVRLTGSSNDRSATFAELFCTVLQKENPDGGDWGPCSQYLEGGQSGDTALTPLSTKYRLLIVPGVLSSCTTGAPAFQQGQEHLRTKYNMSVDLIAMPNDSSENNAQLITSYIAEQRKTDSRKFIVVGYSKGAPDTQVALASDPDAAAGVAAFISVAGAVGGSPIADLLPAAAERYMNALHLTNCQGDLNAAFKSLRRDVRQMFLGRFPDPIVPTYSLSAVSGKTNTSKMLLQSWLVLFAYDPKEDSTLTKFDTIVPGSSYLGSALADHLAVALPFDKVEDATIRATMDQNKYPRTALLESLVRFVIQDLEKSPTP
ncbi:MAG: LssY C-terminal domain-containing protein [Acidobacteria bacterium]|nr:LssY C-terminal domain-containing protein [Acidobacteriota bacterium]